MGFLVEEVTKSCVSSVCLLSSLLVSPHFVILNHIVKTERVFLQLYVCVFC
jgi:hypothetical protein